MLPINEIICFKSDTAERKRYFKAASFAHPAKMVLGLQIYLIEHYTKPGDVILDPMTGSGTILIACTLGRNVVCVELEEKFVKMQQDNWEKIKSLGPMLGHQMGQATILQGDARDLDGLLADNILFSPPYAEAQTGGGLSSASLGIGNYKVTTKLPKPAYDPRTHGKTKGQIANLPYGEISAVISSPPYEGSGVSAGNVGREIEKRWGKGKSLSSGRKYADAVITSPPYEGSLESSRHVGGIVERENLRDNGGNMSLPVAYTDLDPNIKRLRKHDRSNKKAGGPYGKSLAHPYSGADENIGNLKNENYLQAMLSVYRQCRGVLKKDGLLVLVTKNFIRDKKVIRLDLDTIKLCEQAGFILKERLQRKLTQQSFWRTIYHKKFPDVEKIEYEDVIIFMKK